MKRRLILQAAGSLSALSSLGGLPGTAVCAEGGFSSALRLADERVRVDVMIAGTGAAGLCAALAAREAGAERVLVIEKLPLAGGHTLISSGSVSVARTPEEVVGLMNEMLDAGGGRADPALVRVVCEGSWAAKERLARLGVAWSEAPFRAVGAPSARSWNTGTAQSGYDYVQALMRAVRRAGIEVRFSMPATALLVEDRQGVRRVTGLTAERSDGRRLLVEAGAVVLATGGFTGNAAMIRRSRPDIPRGMETTGNPMGEYLDGSTGDGILMAVEAGAALRDMDAVIMLPFAGGRLVDYVGGEVWVNAQGRRFISEGAGFAELCSRVLKEPGARMWAVSDALAPKGATLPMKLMNGAVKEAPDLAALARGIGCSETVLRETLERYNRSVVNGWDEDFGIPMRGLPVATPPFYYGLETLSIHYTAGGIAITPQAEVKDAAGRVIPGLYAAGETTGGVHGALRVGGLGLTDALVMGDVAGREAAGAAAAAASAPTKG